MYRLTSRRVTELQQSALRRRRLRAGLNLFNQEGERTGYGGNY